MFRAEHPQLDRRLKEIRRKLVATILPRFVLILVLPLMMIAVINAEPVEAG